MARELGWELHIIIRGTIQHSAEESLMRFQRVLDEAFGAGQIAHILRLIRGLGRWVAPDVVLSWLAIFCNDDINFLAILRNE